MTTNTQEPQDSKPNIPAIILIVEFILFIGFACTHKTMNMRHWANDDILIYIATAVVVGATIHIALTDVEDEGLDDSG